MESSSRPANGYTAWRLIAEELRADIAEGRLQPGDRLPSENDLAERFGVHRQTARQAVSALSTEGLVSARRGSGTFVTEGHVLVHRIGLRTRLGSSLGPTGSAPGARVLSHVTEPAPDAVAARLRLAGPEGTRIETLNSVDGRPITRATHWFDPVRLPGIVNALRRTGSVTSALQEAGIDDYVRLSTTITARYATGSEAADLALEPGSVVLVTQGVDALPDGTPLQYIVTRFAASRVALDIEHPAVTPD
ncbi:MAG: phosphonate metabolism transcriptional regulator PhnF [Actinomycetota bacterium]